MRRPEIFGRKARAPPRPSLHSCADGWARACVPQKEPRTGEQLVRQMEAWLAELAAERGHK